MSKEKEAELSFQVLAGGFPPKKGTTGAAGWDIATPIALEIKAGARITIDTQVRVATPPGTYAQLVSRSGLAKNNGIVVYAGVVDEDYRGNIGVILHNTGTEDYSFKVGDRIAQLIIVKIHQGGAQILGPDDKLPVTKRGTDGFGSTGN